jgi:hypothetical protein
MASGSSATHSVSGRKGLVLTLSLLCAVLAFLFHNCFFPGYALFSNDGPLGALIAECRRVPAGFSGGWYDLNTLGYREGGALPDITYGLLWLLGPVGYSKFYAAIALLILGSGAWTFLRCMGLGNLACTLGAIAAVLNSSFFSAACWGVAAHPLTIGLSFFALAALTDTSSRRRWLRVALAGLAVGMGVVEGADIGAIFSLYVAAFVFYQALIVREAGSRSLLAGIGRLAIVAGFAVFIAVQSLSVLITTQIAGVAGTQQDKETKEQHWDFATQWSLPKREALGFIIPGLFGYRMDTPDGGEYWGAVGRDPNWDRYFANGKQGPPPGGTMRFSGGGSYAGVLVLIVAVWAVLQSFRKNNSIFAPPTRKWIWFWCGVFVVSLLLAFGRFAPFYQFFYALPYFSTIRNPAKFTYPCAWALVVLFSYGVNGLWKIYVEAQPAKRASERESFGSWWHRVRGFDRRWTIGCGIALAAAVLGWLIFGSSQDAFERYLQEVQFEPARAHAIAKFSVGQVGLFLVFFAAAIALVTLIISGAFRGRGAKWGGILLGVLLVFDLGRANEPWIVPWNYVEKYASNPIIDFLRQKPYEHRVASLPQWLVPAMRDRIPPELAQAEANIRQLYAIEWAQHHFLYYNIESLDVIQMPRMPEDLFAYETKFFPRSSADLPKVTRHWELTNTRYLLGAAGFLDLLNQQFDPAQHRFRIAEQFNIEPKPGVTNPTKPEEWTAVLQTNGPLAVFEFTGALPRAALFTDWRTVTNEQATLDELASPSFDPDKTVLVSSAVPGSAGLSGTNAGPGEVKFVSYAPKHIVFSAKADAPSVLLLNDRFDPNWKVSVDGNRQALLRCNFLMRGVYIPAGSHNVEFRFVQPMGPFYVSLGGVIVAVLLSAILLILPRSPALHETGTGSSKSETAPKAIGK